MKRSRHWGETKPRWEWEKTKKVVVFAIDDKLGILTPKVIRWMQELLDEFAIPLDVMKGNLEYSTDLALVKKTLDQSIRENKIDWKEFEEKLRKVRYMGRTPYGVVILVDKVKYQFYDYKIPNEKRAYYGVGDDGGYVILRHTHKEAVRHEFAHMLGLCHHVPPRPDCIMNWECPTPSFCDDCKRKIAEMWQDEIEGR